MIYYIHSEVLIMKKVCLARIFLSTVHIANTTELKMILCSAKSQSRSKTENADRSSMTRCCVCRMSRFLRLIFRQRILNFNPPYFYYTGMNFVNILFSELNYTFKEKALPFLVKLLVCSLYKFTPSENHEYSL